jgi:hypothetical protein
VTDNRLTLVASKVIGPSPIGFPSGTIYSWWCCYPAWDFTWT